MKEERFTEELPCKLTEAEKVLRGDQLVQKLAERDKVHADAKADAAAYRKDLEEIDATVSSIAKAIRDGSELREVDVIERPNYTIDQVELVRLDTSEVYETRAFEHDERQLGMELARPADEMPAPLEDAPMSDEEFENSAKPNAPA